MAKNRRIRAMEIWKSRKKPRDSHIPTAIIGIQTNEDDVNLLGPKKCLDNGVHLNRPSTSITAVLKSAKSPYSVPVRQVAALLPRFLQTAPRGHRPCASLALCLHQTWAEDLHLRAVKHARHTRRRGRTERAHRALDNAARFPRASTGHFHQIIHEKPRKAPRSRWETRIDPEKRQAGQTCRRTSTCR